MVDPAGSRLQAGDDPVAARQIVGENTGGQPKLGGIGARDDTLFVLELEHRHDRSEYLLAHDRHVVATIVEYRRRDEESLGEFAPGHAHAARENLRTLGAPTRDVAQDLMHVL